MNNIVKKIKSIIKGTAPASTYGTNPNDPWSAKAGIAESSNESMLDSYLNSRGINPRFISTDTRISHAKSSEFMKWKNDHQFESVQEETDKKDTVTMDIPLLIRVLELAREDIKSDMDLHKVVEKLINIRDKGMLTMDDYDYIAKLKEEYELQEGQFKRGVIDREEDARLNKMTTLKKFRADADARTKKHDAIEKNSGGMTSAIDRLQAHMNKEETELHEDKMMPPVHKKVISKAGNHIGTVYKYDKPNVLGYTYGASYHPHGGRGGASGVEWTHHDNPETAEKTIHRQHGLYKAAATKQLQKAEKHKTSIPEEVVNESETHELAIPHSHPYRHEMIGNILKKHGAKHNGQSDKSTYFKVAADKVHAAKSELKSNGVRADHWINGELKEETELEKKASKYDFTKTKSGKPGPKQTKPFRMGNEPIEKMNNEDVTRTATGLINKGKYGTSYTGDTVETSKQKDSKDLNYLNKKLTKDLEKGMDVHFDKVKEETEQIDEISRKALDTYKAGSLASLKNAQSNRDAASHGKDFSTAFAKLHKKSNEIAKKRTQGLIGYMQRKGGMKPFSEDIFQDGQAPTQTSFDGANAPDNTEPKTNSRRTEMSKSARIIKSLYKHHNMKEELYDSEKEDKSVASYGKKPKMKTTKPEDSFGDNPPTAAAVLTGGKTLTGSTRDTLEIDPEMKRPTRPDGKKQEKN